MNDKFMRLYSKFCKPENNFMGLMENIINRLDKKDTKYIRNKKYTTVDYIYGIIEVISNNISWRKYNGKIDGRILNNKHNHYVKIGVYEEFYKVNLREYSSVNKETIKELSIDSSFIPNNNGTEELGRNIFYKNKRGRKVTVIVDSKGIPLNIRIDSGNVHDAKIAPKILNKVPINRTK